jgi:hypothetical protein
MQCHGAGREPQHKYQARDSSCGSYKHVVVVELTPGRESETVAATGCQLRPTHVTMILQTQFFFFLESGTQTTD